MLPESSGRLVALRVAGKLTKEDMVTVAPPLEEKIRENGKVDLLCDMTDLHGWSLGGFWAELKFDAKHAKDFRRVAVITGKPLHRFMASMLKPFTSAEIKCFQTREKNRRSNLDFPQLIALNVGDFIRGCKFGRRTRVPFERWPETRADRIFDRAGAQN